MIWAAGADYKVSFHDGATFVPYLGREYPHNQPWSWRTASAPPSSLTLQGLVQHLAEVERNWFQRVLGRMSGLPYGSRVARASEGCVGPTHHRNFANSITTGSPDDSGAVAGAKRRSRGLQGRIWPFVVK